MPCKGLDLQNDQTLLAFDPLAKRNNSLLSRRDLSLLVSYLSSHHTVNSHLVKMQLESVEEWRLCKKDLENSL